MAAAWTWGKPQVEGRGVHRGDAGMRTLRTLDKHLSSYLPPRIEHQNPLFNDMTDKSKNPSLIDAVGTSPGSGPATSTSSIIMGTSSDPIPSVPTSIATASAQVIDVATARESGPDFTIASAESVQNPSTQHSVLDPFTNDQTSARLPSSHSHDAMTQGNVESTESERGSSVTQRSGLGFFANALGVPITGGFFANALGVSITGGTFVSNILPVYTGQWQMKIPIPMPQKLNSSPVFTGREDVLDKLGKIFVHPDESQLRHSCLLWGMGGIGKTQICLKFIEQMSDRFEHVFWIDASSQESITMSFKGISNNIPTSQASGVDGSVESVLQWISHIQEEWLMVFDNAGDPISKMVEKFVSPGSRGNILVTSRNPVLGKDISFENSIEINEMEEKDAVTLLLKASNFNAVAEHLQAAKELVTELGCIPLAVERASAYIFAGKLDINQCLRQTFLHRQIMLHATFGGALNYDNAVYETWDLSFKEIEKRAGGDFTMSSAKAAQAAILILKICAFYHHSNISKDIFQSAAEKSRQNVGDSEVDQVITFLDHTLLSLDKDEHWDDVIFEQGIDLLLSFSLIKREKSSNVLSVHPLVHFWSREQMSKYEQQIICQMGSIILSCAIPWRFTSQDHVLRQMLFSHIKANEFYGNELGLEKQYYDDKYTKFALVMWEDGDWINAEQLSIQIMLKRQKILGAEHLDTLKSMENLASMYQQLERWTEAEKLEVQVMNMRKKLLGEEHLDTLMSMEKVVSIYQGQGRKNGVEQLQVQVMDIKKKLLGEEHPDTLRIMANLASIYHGQERWNEAEQIGAQLLEIKKKLFGEEHPDTLTSMENLASTYWGQLRWDGAEQLGLQVVNMRKKLFGAEHTETLKSMEDLAKIYHNQGKWTEAEQLEVQLMDIRKKLLGIEHPDTLVNMENLARTYDKQERWTEAGLLQVQVMDMRRKMLDADDPIILLSMENLASTYQKQERWNEAENLEVQVMDIRRKLLGAEHPDTLRSMANLASICHNQKRWNEAEWLSSQLIVIRKNLLGPEHPDTLTSMENLASTYWGQQMWNEAEQLELQVMDIRKKLLGPGHPDTLRSIEYLTNIYYNRLRNKSFDVGYPDTLISIENPESKYQKKVRWAKEAQIMDVKKKLFDAEDLDTFTSMSYNPTNTYQRKEKWIEAENIEFGVDNNSENAIDPLQDATQAIVTTQVLIAAEGALTHVGRSEKKAEIKAAFHDLQVLEYQYLVLAGFNEALIDSGLGYLEEIHIFCCIEIPDSLHFLHKLGKVLTPYPGIIFTPSSGYKTPVFKDDGTIWDYDEFSLHHTKRHSDIRAEGISCLGLNAFTSLAESQSSTSSTTLLGFSEGGGDNNGDNGEGGDHDNSGDLNDDDHQKDNNHEGNGSEDDPEDPEDDGNADSLTPGITFEVQAKLFIGTSNPSSSKPFQELEINGTLVVQTDPAQLKPKRLSKSHVEFRKLKLQGSRSSGPAYEQVHVWVEINAKDENTEIDVIQPLQTPAFNQETKEITANKVTTGGTLGGSVGIIKPTATVSLSGSKSKEASSSTESTKYHSRITERHLDGFVSWGFSVEDMNERQVGIEFGGQRALPSVDFEFYGPSDVGPPPPPPEHFEISVTSCWSLISPRNESHTTSRWFSWLQTLSSGLAASEAPLHSNLCQAVILKAPSHLSHKTLYRSVTEVTQSSSNTAVKRQGLHEITSAVLPLDVPRIESGHSYGPISSLLWR